MRKIGHSPPVAIVGRGRAGLALGRSLRASGYRVIFATRRRPLAKGSHVALLVVAVRDAEIRSVAESLSRARIRADIALHLAGAVPAEALSPLVAASGGLVSFHPLRSFSGKAGESFQGALVAIEGDAAAVRRAASLARRIGAHPRRLPTGAKPLYHAAATIAASGTATALGAAIRLARAAGIPESAAREAFTELAQTAVENVRRQGFALGLTGPVARSDRRTLAIHDRALRPWPGLNRLARELKRAARLLMRVDRASPQN
jgi:predicted short-subunit dehydrogenase-like oxidoreductase (DUF2520 family)